MKRIEKRMLAIFLCIALLLASYPAFTGYLTFGSELPGYLALLQKLHFSTGMQIWAIHGIQLILNICCVCSAFWFFGLLTGEHVLSAWLTFFYMICWFRLGVLMERYSLIEGLEVCVLPAVCGTVLQCIRAKRTWFSGAAALVCLGWIVLSRMLRYGVTPADIPVLGITVYLKTVFSTQWLYSILFFMFCCLGGAALRQWALNLSQENKIIVSVFILTAGAFVAVVFGARITDVPVYLM
jgi:hypothetical protein